jgi:hypothetical protein
MQGLSFARQALHQLSHASSTFSFYYQVVPSLDHDPPTYASHVADTHHQAGLTNPRWVLTNFLPRLTLSHDPLNIFLSNNWDYRNESLCPAISNVRKNKSEVVSYTNPNCELSLFLVNYVKVKQTAMTSWMWIKTQISANICTYNFLFVKSNFFYSTQKFQSNLKIIQYKIEPKPSNKLLNKDQGTSTALSHTWETLLTCSCLCPI